MNDNIVQLKVLSEGEVIACFDMEQLTRLIHSREDVFSHLVDSMSGETHLLHPNKEALRESFKEGLGCVVVLKKEGEVSVVGYCRLIPLTSHEGEVWYEFGSVFMSETVRNLGVSTEMYKVFLARHKEKNILATTTNQAAVAVGYKVEMKLVTRKELPVSVWQASCTCDSAKTKSASSATCTLAYGENDASSLCYFRVSKETHEMFFAKKGKSA